MFEERTTLEDLEVRKTYDFSTSYVEGKLQKQINNILQSAGDKTPMKIQLRSIELKDDVRKKGKGIAPFVLVLPNSARRQIKVDDKNRIDPIFENEEVREKVMLRPELFRLLSAYMYTKDDIHYLSQTRNRREMNLTNQHYMFLRQYANIKAFTSNKGETKMLMVLLNPMNVFRSILINKENPKERFDVYVDKITKMTSTNFVYSVTREPAKANHNESMNELMQRLNKCISGASGV